MYTSGAIPYKRSGKKNGSLSVRDPFIEDKILTKNGGKVNPTKVIFAAKDTMF